MNEQDAQALTAMLLVQPVVLKHQKRAARLRLLALQGLT